VEKLVTEADHLIRAIFLIEHAIRRRWAEGLITKDADGVFTSFLGANDVERLLKPTEPTTRVDDFAYAPDGRLATLSSRLGLGPSELDLIAVLLACETDARASRLVTYLGGNQAAHALTFELLLEIVYRARAHDRSDAAAMLFRDLSPHGVLRRLHCVVVDGVAQRVTLAQGVRLERRVVAWLLGERGIDPDLHLFARWFEPDAAALPAPACDVEPLTAALRARGRVVDRPGPRSRGRELLARHGAVAAGKPLLVVDAAGLGAARLVAAFREACLSASLLAFTDADELLAGEMLLALQTALAAYEHTVIMIGCREHQRTLALLRPTTTLRLEVPAFGDRLELWRRYLGDQSALSEAELGRVAATYNLGISGIVRASDRAREVAQFAGAKIDRAGLQAAVRTLFDTELTTVARRAEVRQSWDDLVLPDDLTRSVRSILDRVPHRGQVLGDWGFARKVGKGLGLTILFSGEPGTGKSMAASLIAAELGLDLYVVDLSQVSSKWLGETEKNIGRAFDAAEAGHVVLLFDEADSLFTKRTADVKSSNDRYANQETNFILARLEQFEGIAFFTTNLGNAIDQAVARRMSVTIRFPFPDEDTREELWRRMIPAQAPVDATINFEELAGRYEISGGIIRNIVLRAAYLAAHDRRAIAMEHMTSAAEMEYRDRGSLATRGRLL
jgi:hypothetical protein